VYPFCLGPRCAAALLLERHPPCAVAAAAHTPSVCASAPAAAQPCFLCGFPPAPLPPPLTLSQLLSRPPLLRCSLASCAASPLRRCRRRSHSLSFCLGPRCAAALLLVRRPPCAVAMTLSPPLTLPQFVPRPPLRCSLASCEASPLRRCCDIAAAAHTPSVCASAPAAAQCAALLLVRLPPCAVAAAAHTPSVSVSAPAAAQPCFLSGVPPAP
jgi:hypothetical protein